MEKLVDIITKEVMKRLQGSLNLNTCNNSNALNNAPSKEKVVVISSNEQELRDVERLIGDKYEVHLYDKANSNLNMYEYIVVTNLCNKGLATMALGSSNDASQEFIIEALLSGKNVYLMNEGIQYKKYASTANVNIYNQFKAYEEKLISYGVKLTNKNILLESLEKGLICKEESQVSQKPCLVQENPISAPQNICVSDNTSVYKESEQNIQIVPINNKRLIAESDLRKLYMNGIKEVTIAKKSILTPLAQDFIRINHLKVNRI